MGTRFARVSSLRVAAMVVALVLLVGIAVLAAGCARATVGPVQELVIDEPFVAGDVVEVELSLQLGTLSLSPGATGLVSGTVQYNIDQWKPDIKREDDALTIKQGSANRPEVPAMTIVNDWDLMLGPTPMQLNIDVGEVACAFDLGGLSLLGLDLKDGGTETQVTFSAPNPSQMKRFFYDAGASKVTLERLANANMAGMAFVGDNGTYTFDFSGGLRSDTAAGIFVGDSTVRIEVPAGTRAQVKMTGNDVDLTAQGAWIIEGSTYSTPALVDDDGGRTLTIELKMESGGSATLVCE